VVLLLLCRFVIEAVDKNAGVATKKKRKKEKKKKRKKKKKKKKTMHVSL
jgi:hypothetical protein